MHCVNLEIKIANYAAGYDKWHYQGICLTVTEETQMPLLISSSGIPVVYLTIKEGTWRSKRNYLLTYFCLSPTDIRKYPWIVYMSTGPYTKTARHRT